jgi:hypothetical protein
MYVLCIKSHLSAVWFGHYSAWTPLGTSETLKPTLLNPEQAIVASYLHLSCIFWLILWLVWDAQLCFLLMSNAIVTRNSFPCPIMLPFHVQFCPFNFFFPLFFKFPFSYAAILCYGRYWWRMMRKNFMNAYDFFSEC